jgi:hypothetical protein
MAGHTAQVLAPGAYVSYAWPHVQQMRNTQTFAVGVLVPVYAGLTWALQQRTDQRSRAAVLCYGLTGTGAAACRLLLQEMVKACLGEGTAPSCHYHSQFVF